MGTPRTNQKFVRDLINDESANVWAQISIASSIVDDHLADKGLSNGALAAIEAYLAAHFYHLHSPNVVSEKYDHGAVTYEIGKNTTSDNEFHNGYSSTRWGQQALDLDSSGTLRNLHKPRTKFMVL